MNYEESKKKNKKDLGIYIHIPFCRHKCDYCDFVSYEKQEEKINKYVSCLETEIREAGKQNKVDKQKGEDEEICIKTIYIGGGTPSYIDENLIGNILKTLRETFLIYENAEITIEINPRNSYRGENSLLC